MFDLREDEKKFFNYFRMSPAQFDTLVNAINPLLNKGSTNYRKTISTDHRLAVCLRYLATGNSFASLSFSFRLGLSTVCEIVYEVCESIYCFLSSSELSLPDTDRWKKISTRFFQKWNFPHCVGAIDGKHIRMKCPPCSGSLYYNYKGFYSVVLLAVVDADYRFIAVDIGSFGSNSDGGIFANSNFGRRLEHDQLNLPEDAMLVDSPQTGILPYMFVADEAFPLKTCIMRPYPGRYLEKECLIFNYRLSRARRVVENAFGILASRFRVFRSCLEVLPENAVKIIQASVVLHNFLQSQNSEIFEVEGDMPSGTLQGVERRTTGNRPSNAAAAVRNKLKTYFSGDGAVDFQEERANCNIAK